MDRLSRIALRRRLKTRPDPESDQPRDRLVQIDVTLILPRRLGWLLAGIAISNLPLPDGLLVKTGHLLRAFLA